MNANKIIIAIIAAAVAVSVATLIIFKTNRGLEYSALISHNGDTVERIPLSELSENRKIDLYPLCGVNVVLETGDGAIHFLSSDCPDKLCIHAGWLSSEFDTAICMPNKISVVIAPNE